MVSTNPGASNPNNPVPRPVDVDAGQDDRPRQRPQGQASADVSGQSAERRVAAPEEVSADEVQTGGMHGRWERAEGQLTPVRPPRTGSIGRVCASEMEKILEAVECEELASTLQSEDLLDTNRLLQVGGGGLRSLLGGMAYVVTRDKLAAHLRRGGYQVSRSETLDISDRMICACVLREKESNQLREEASGLISPVGGAARAATPRTEKLTSNEKDRVHSDALLEKFSMHQRGKRLASSLTPILGDNVVASEALTRKIGRLPRYDCLAMSTRIDERNGDNKRHHSDKVFTRKRGRSAEEEYNLFEDYMLIIAVSGAQAADDMKHYD